MYSMLFSKDIYYITPLQILIPLGGVKVIFLITADYLGSKEGVFPTENILRKRSKMYVYIFYIKYMNIEKVFRRVILFAGPVCGDTQSFVEFWGDPTCYTICWRWYKEC